MEMLKIYSGFFGEGQHVTWEFNPGNCKLPEGIKNGDNIDFNIVGEFKHEGFHALKVKFGNVENANNGNPLHISLKWPEGRNPGEIGFLMSDKKDLIYPKSGTVSLTAGFFEVEAK